MQILVERRDDKVMLIASVNGVRHGILVQTNVTIGEALDHIEDWVAYETRESSRREPSSEAGAGGSTGPQHTAEAGGGE
jgi:hypothetical protein